MSYGIYFPRSLNLHRWHDTTVCFENKIKMVERWRQNNIYPAFAGLASTHKVQEQVVCPHTLSTTVQAAPFPRLHEAVLQAKGWRKKAELLYYNPCMGGLGDSSGGKVPWGQM